MAGKLRQEPTSDKRRRQARRIDLACTVAGFDAPPVALQIKMISGIQTWHALILAPAGKTAAAGDWLLQHCDAQFGQPSDVGERVLRAKIPVLPHTWEILFKSADVHHIDISPHGMAAIFLDASNQQVRELLDALHIDQEVTRTRLNLGGPPELTKQQGHVFAAAIALGYYDIPHNINLRMLAKHLGTSLGTTAEVLRRAESAIMKNYADRGSAESCALLESATDGAPGARA